MPAIAERPELVGPVGTLKPLGVVAGMVFFVGHPYVVFGAFEVVSEVGLAARLLYVARYGSAPPRRLVRPEESIGFRRDREQGLF